jgi:hypothetical protein
MRRRKLDAKVGLNFRVEERLRRKLAAAAKANENSLNQEIKKRLEASFEIATVENIYTKLEKVSADLERGIQRFDAPAARMQEALKQSEPETKSAPEVHQASTANAPPPKKPLSD